MVGTAWERILWLTSMSRLAHPGLAGAAAERPSPADGAAGTRTAPLAPGSPTCAAADAQSPFGNATQNQGWPRAQQEQPLAQEQPVVPA